MANYEPTPVAAHNQIVEQAAQAADAEADHLQKLADEIRVQHERSPRRGLKWRMEELLAGARAARRIAIAIRKLKVSEEEG